MLKLITHCVILLKKKDIFDFSVTTLSITHSVLKGDRFSVLCRGEVA